MADPCCPCDVLVHPPPPDIAPGLAVTIWPQRNSWRLAPIRGGVFDGRLLFAGSRARLAVGQIVVLAQGSPRAAARVKALTSETALDGDTYVHAELQPPPTSLTGVPIAGLTITAVTQQASANPFDSSASLSGNSASITLDRVYPQLHAGDIAIVESAAQLIAATISSTALVMVPVPVTTPSIRPLHPLIGRSAAAAAAPQPAAPATRI